MHVLTIDTRCCCGVTRVALTGAWEQAQPALARVFSEPYPRALPNARSITRPLLDCGGKRSATPLFPPRQPAGAPSLAARPPDPWHARAAEGCGGAGFGAGSGHESEREK